MNCTFERRKDPAYTYLECFQYILSFSIQRLFVFFVSKLQDFNSNGFFSPSFIRLPRHPGAPDLEVNLGPVH